MKGRVCISVAPAPGAKASPRPKCMRKPLIRASIFGEPRTSASSGAVSTMRSICVRSRSADSSATAAPVEWAST